MELDDFLESETAIAVAATATVLSPRVRSMVRRGAVYGVAGALIAGDAAASVARGFGRGTQEASSSAGGVVQGTTGKIGGVLQGAAQRARGVTRSAGSES
jgi:hypothetical protein